MGGSAVMTKVKDVGELVGPKARELRGAIGPKAKDLSETLGPKVKVARRRVGYWIAGEEPRKAKKWPVVAATGAGVLLTYLFDPVSGTRRRAAARDWVAARFVKLTGRSPRPTPTIEQSALHLDETFAPIS